MIEIKNFDKSRANKSFLGNFEAVSKQSGMIIAECEAFTKDGSVYARLPSKSFKLPDGTYGPKKPIIYFIDQQKTNQLQEAITKSLQQYFSSQTSNVKEDELPF